jgi:dolichol-phosphate mannosyltransferase
VCSAVDADTLRPNGIKILLELLLSGKALITRDVTFRFGARRSGNSKASWQDQIAILANFALTECFVFRGARTDKPLVFRFASYLLISNASLLISGPLLLLLVSALAMDLLLANVLSLALLFLARFSIAVSYIWSGVSLDPRRLAFSEAKA